MIGAVINAINTVASVETTLPNPDQLAPYILKLLPTKARKPTLKVMTEMNSQLASYNAINTVASVETTLPNPCSVTREIFCAVSVNDSKIFCRLLSMCC
jgi:predicted PurR-regulated permease PerM